MAEKIDDLADFQNLSLYAEARSPIGFKMPHIEKFSGNTPPHLHLRSYVRTMQLYGLKEEHLAQGFHLTLSGLAHRWFFRHGRTPSYQLEKHCERIHGALQIQ